MSDISGKYADQLQFAVRELKKEIESSNGLSNWGDELINAICGMNQDLVGEISQLNERLSKLEAK